MENASAAGPFDQWPCQRGFDRYYGFLDGETDQFHPELVYDNHHVDQPKSVEDGYHLSEDLVDHAFLAARVMGASRWQIFKDVLIWESLQPTFVGLRSAVSMALVIVIVAEMFIGSDNGLGHRIIDAQQVLNVKSMYAAILAAGALGYALNILFLVAERRIVHWSGR